MKRKVRPKKLAKASGYDAGSPRPEPPTGEGSPPPHAYSDASAEAMSLGDLIAEAGVTVRTVRYYIAEGLLPPPAGAGPATAYGRGHLDRLRLIQRLKEAYLPIREIRRRLAGLDDRDVRAILAAGEDVEEATALHESPEDATLAEARDYLRLIMESREGYRTRPLAFEMAELPAPPRLRGETAGSGLQAKASAGWDDAPSIALSGSQRLPEPGEGLAPPTEHDGALWRRIPLGDDAELVLSDQAYLRHRERVDWLVRWARKVFA